MSTLLAGIRVIDVATARGDMAGRVLADLGAEVIKVEPPGGCAARRLPPFDMRAGRGESLTWAAMALGKKSVVLDIAASDGLEQLRRLVSGADIFIESWDPGEAARHGLAYDELASSNSGLVYVSISPFGQSGPRAGAAASDLTIQASSGLMSFVGEGDRPPLAVPHMQAACHAGVQAAADAVMALCERTASGLGQHLDVSMQAAMIWTLLSGTGWPVAVGRDQPGAGADRASLRKEIRPGVPADRIVRCRDGYVLPAIVGTAATSGGTNSTLAALVKWGFEEGLMPAQLVGTDWRNWEAGLDSGRLQASQVCEAIGAVQAFLLTRSKQDVLEHAARHGLGMAPVLGPDDLPRDRQLQARHYWVEVGGRTHPGAFVQFSRTPIRLASAPDLGGDQHLLDAPPARSSPRVTAGARQQSLAGLKVADFTWAGVGPLTTKALADHGASVVHVESASRVDTLRRAGAPWQGKPGPDRSHFFSNYNTSKFGLALNITTAEGRDVARRLIDWADIVVDSFTPGTMTRRGLDYAELRRVRPELITVSSSLRGSTGPGAMFRGYGSAGAALAGLHAVTGWPDRPPCGPGVAYTDTIAPRYLVAAIVGAVLERQRSGLGQHIDLSQVEASIHFIEPLVLDCIVNGRVGGPIGNTSDLACPHGVYACAGTERYIAISVEIEAQWRGLLGVLGTSAFDAAEYLAIECRLSRRDAIDQALSSWARLQDPGHAESVLAAAGVPAAVVMRPSDLYADAQLRHRGFFVTLDHPVMGSIAHDGFATRFSATPPRLSRPGPCFGQHTDHVLTAMLGYSAGEVAALRQKEGVLA
jgi:crotonobetainyl-CoA:carnitine CoA-transferase CaiB-like acyl-CoA transferase